MSDRQGHLHTPTLDVVAGAIEAARGDTRSVQELLTAEAAENAEPKRFFSAAYSVGLSINPSFL